MADTTSPNPETAAPAPAEQMPIAEPATAPAAGEAAEDAKPTIDIPKEESEKSEDATKLETTAPDEGDVEMKEATEAAPAAVATETPNAKNKNRRKSVGGGLSRKGSKARLTHTDAKPGDHFLMKLKGFPPWPVIICDESMLPPALTGTRPVSAARVDGSYADAYADGGKRVHDRTFPVMYLFTNEFGWAANTTLNELTEEKARNSINDKMRKDLRAAFELAIEQHPVEHYKEVLAKFEEEQLAQQQAEEEARKEAAATPKKGKKGKKADEDDLEMPDGDSSAKPKSKKRKAEEEISPPQRSDSVKKPKIKLNMSSTPKANGTPSKKAESATKPKSEKKAKEAKKPKEPKMTPEEKRERKQREVFFLRHKLQKGLLSKEQPPVEAEMESMSAYLTALENFTELEASIIRETKINKVLKAILKMDNIPREEHFNFKKRSQGLLDSWNKLLASAAAAAPAGNTNGVNGSEDKKDQNGTSEEAPDTKDASAKITEEKEKTEEPSEPAEPAEPAAAEEKAPEAVEASAD